MLSIPVRQHRMRVSTRGYGRLARKHWEHGACTSSGPAPSVLGEHLRVHDVLGCPVFQRQILGVFGDWPMWCGQRSLLAVCQRAPMACRHATCSNETWQHSALPNRTNQDRIRRRWLTDRPASAVGRVASKMICHDEMRHVVSVAPPFPSMQQGSTACDGALYCGWDGCWKRRIHGHEQGVLHHRPYAEAIEFPKKCRQSHASK